MPEEKTSNMQKNITRRIRYYFIALGIIVITTIWWDEIFGSIREILGGDKETLEETQNIAETVIAIIGALALVLLSFMRDLDLHNWLDSTIFHVREKTGSIIEEHLIDAAKRVGAQNYDKMRGEKKKIMHLFYYFINKEEVTRSLAFTYWEQYFLNIYIVILAILSSIICFIVIIVNDDSGSVLFVPLGLVVVAILTIYRTKTSLVKRIYDLPVQQIEDIRTAKASDLRVQVDQRF